MPSPVVALRLPPELLQRIDERARTEGKDRSMLLREVLSAAFPEQGQTSVAGPAFSNARTKLKPVPPLRRV